MSCKFLFLFRMCIISGTLRALIGRAAKLGRYLYLLLQCLWLCSGSRQLPAEVTAEPLALAIPFSQQWQLVLQEVSISEERLCESYGLI